jgi:hypothetical protein
VTTGSTRQSSVLRTFVELDLAVRLTQRLRQLTVVCAPTSQSRRVLELAGLGAHARVLADIETALAALRSPDAEL